MSVRFESENRPVLGEDIVWKAAAIFSDGTIKSLEGATIWLGIKEDADDTDEEAVLLLNSEDNPDNFVVTNAVAGLYTITIFVEDQSSIKDTEQYFIEVKIEFEDGERKVHGYDKIKFAPSIVDTLLP